MNTNMILVYCIALFSVLLYKIVKASVKTRRMKSKYESGREVR